MKNFLKESYEPKIKNGLYNTALMNLDDVRKSLPTNTPKEIWDLYQQLFDALENENVNSITSDDSNGFTIFIQAIDPHDRYYQQFVGKTFELCNTHHITKEEEHYLGVEGCDYIGEINVNGEIQLIPFEKNSINSKIPVSFEWIYAGYIKSKIQESKNMKKDSKKALYENIMTSVAKEVKKVLNEGIFKQETIYFPPVKEVPHLSVFKLIDTTNVYKSTQNTPELENVYSYDVKKYFENIFLDKRLFNNFCRKLDNIEAHQFLQTPEIQGNSYVIFAHYKLPEKV